jgi:uncharacterized RDD family membrane protein YckC
LPPPPPGAPNPYAYPPPAYGYQPYGAQGQGTYASFGARLGALLLDSLIVGLPIGVIWVALFFGLSHDGLCRDQFSDSGTGYVNCRTVTGGSAGLLFLVVVLLGILSIVYYVVMIGRTGQTVGKRIVGVKVVDARSGQPIGIPRALGRHLMQGISGAVCYLGYLWMLWDDHSQTWHDKVVDSIVVKS